MTEASDETIVLPPDEKVAINRMSDRFHEAMGKIKPAPAEQQPAAAAPALGAEPALPAETKGQARQAFEKLKGLKDRAELDAATLRAELEKLTAPAPGEPPELPTTAKDWKYLKGLRNKAVQDAEAAAKERDRYKVELETIKKNGAPEMEALKKEVAARDLIVKQFAVSQDPRFQNHFAEKFQSALTEAKEAAGQESAEQVEQIFALPASTNRDLQIEQLAEALDLSDMRRLDLLDSYKSHKKAERERTAELAKAPENFKILQEQAARVQQDRELKQVRERALLFQHIAGSIANDLTGVDETQSKAILGDTKTFVDGKASTELYVRTLADAARWRRYEPTMKQQAELIETLQGQLSEMQASNPTVQSNGPSVTRKQPPDRDNRDLGGIFRKAMAGKPVHA